MVVRLGIGWEEEGLHHIPALPLLMSRMPAPVLELELE